MKARAFLQAAFLVLVFVGSWFFLFIRLNRDESIDRGKTSTPQVSRDEAAEPVEPAVTDDPLAARTTAGKTVNPSPPESWADWIRYLEAVDSPQAMRAALNELGEAILESPREEAIRSILEFLESRADLKTGLGFQPGPANSLQQTASLRAFLLDLLHQLDPALAAEWATEELSRLGTSLNPDVYAVHLRNYALGSTQPEGTRLEFLNRHLKAVLTNDQWTRNPSSAIAESLDVAVYTGATNLVPALSGLMEIGAPQTLRHAAALAIERLVDGDPVAALSEMLQQDDWPTGLEKARAGYFARIDPGLTGARLLLEEYMSSPMVSTDEARFFLLSFPNLNQSLSHNLLSSQISITPSAAKEEILASALHLVREWQGDPSMSRLEPTLAEVERAIDERLHGRVSP